MSLTREAILGADDIQTETVDVPGWGDKVTVKGLTGAELDDYQNSVRRFRAGQVEMLGNGRAKLLVRTLVDDSGRRLFEDKDAAALGKKSGRIIDQLYDVAARLSGLSEEEQDEMEGNSEAAESAASTSTSPENSG